MNLIPFFPQEQPESCVPACLRMLLAYYGSEYDEREIYACCETDVGGTLPSSVVHCAQSLGFIASAPHLPNLNTLKEQIEITYPFPSIYLNLSPILGINVVHAMIVETLDEATDQIQLIDPAYPPNGRRTFSLSLLELGWQLARRRVILIAPGS